MRFWRRIGLIGLIALTVSASTGSASAAEANTWIRFGHFTAGPPVNVTMDGTVVVTNLNFGQISGYRVTTVGRHEVSYSAAGGAVVSANLPLAWGAATTVSPLATSQSEPVESLVSFSDNLAAPARGTAKLRIINADAAIPTLTVTATAGGHSLTIPGIVYKTATGYADVSPDHYDVRAMDAKGVATVLGRAWPVMPNTVTTVVVLAGTSGPTIEAIVDPGGQPGVIPLTGSDVKPELLLGVVLLVLGFALSGLGSTGRAHHQAMLRRPGTRRTLPGKRHPAGMWDTTPAG